VIRVALKGLGGRKLRAALTAFAIILGVAMMSGTFVLTDTIDKAFSQIFDESYAGTDVVVSGQGADISKDGLSSTAPPVDEALVEEVRSVEGVEAATGIVADEFNTKIIGSDGEALSTEGAPSFGFGLDVTPETERFNPLNIVEGTWADADGEVVLDAGTADEEGFQIGETVRISTLEPAQDFEIVGIARFGEVNSLGTATFAVFDVQTRFRLRARKARRPSNSSRPSSPSCPPTRRSARRPPRRRRTRTRSASSPTSSSTSCSRSRASPSSSAPS
jgi:putative ABC transport system permease protein